MKDKVRNHKAVTKRKGKLQKLQLEEDFFDVLKNYR